MKKKTLLDYCLAKSAVFEDRPFDHETIVMKVKGKIFALFNDQDPVISISLKCDPDHALALRAQYPAVTGGYHLNKRHWNSVALNGTIPDDEIFFMIDESYDLVAAKLPKRDRVELGIVRK